MDQEFCNYCRAPIEYITRNGKRIPIHKNSCREELYTNTESFTRPFTCNCGAEVFYYRSEHGGEVVFDALGPPWPKHQCYLRQNYLGLEERGLIPVVIESLLENSDELRVRTLFNPKRTLKIKIIEDIVLQLTRYHRSAPVFIESSSLQKRGTVSFHTLLEKPIKPYADERTEETFSFEGKRI